MKVDSPLDEFEYWIQRLSLELQSGTALRHIVALGRLCDMQADRLRKERTARPGELSRRLRLSQEWLSLAERVERLQQQAEARPLPRRSERPHLRLVRAHSAPAKR